MLFSRATTYTKDGAKALFFWTGDYYKSRMLRIIRKEEMDFN